MNEKLNVPAKPSQVFCYACRVLRPNVTMTPVLLVMAAQGASMLKGPFVIAMISQISFHNSSIAHVSLHFLPGH